MHGANVKILHVPPGDLHISPVVGVPSFELLLYTRITWPTIGIIMEPLCVCVGQWSFWFHTERIFLHYCVTISFSIRFLLYVVYGACSYSTYGSGVEGSIFCLLG